MNRSRARAASFGGTSPLIRRSPLPGLFITGTDTGVGKTVVAGAIANWFRREGKRVAVLKPVATGCVHRREGLVSEDAEFLAACADASHPLDLIAPERYIEPLAPLVAAERASRPVDWTAIQRSIDLMARDSDILIVEGIGGVLVPIDEQHTVRDLASWLELPAVVAARSSLGTINHTLLTVESLRSADVKVAGIVVNRYPAENPSVAEETAPRVIEKWGRVPVLCILPDEPVTDAHLPPGIVAAAGLVDWSRLTRPDAD
jgi:dethiobiotin synthetase